MRKTIFYTAAAAAALLAGTGAKAQTNIQIQYDFGSDRQHITTTLEGLYNDAWGNTFFFIDHDFNTRNAAGQVVAPSGTYLEISRCLNFWQDSALAPLSLHVEYDGGVYRGYTINNALLAGIDWFLHSKDFRNTLNLKVLYKYIAYTDPEFSSRVPMQFTAAWTMKDLFGLTGLTFTGFADFWWEDHTLLSDRYGEILPQTSNPAPDLSLRVHLRTPALVQCRTPFRLRQPQSRRRGGALLRLRDIQRLPLPSLRRTQMGVLTKKAAQFPST